MRKLRVRSEVHFYEDPVFSDSRYPNFSLETFLQTSEIAWKSYSAADHEEVAIDCPACHERGEPTADTKKKLWINVKRGSFYCYRCEFSGSLAKLVQKLANTTFTTALRILRGRSLDPMEHLQLKLYIEKFEDEETEESLKEIELPYGYAPIEGPHPYLEERMIPWKFAAENDWGIGMTGYTKDRLIVPFFMENRMVFWQARYLGTPPDEETQKVLNPKGVGRKNILFNYDTAKTFKEIVITEGFIDCVKVGPHAVATNAKSLHPAQVEWLQKTNAKTIILAWDADAWTDAKRKKPCSIDRAASLLKAAGFAVRGAKMRPGRDPGSYPWESSQLRKRISEAKFL